MMTYQQKLQYCCHPISHKLIQTVTDKQSNLAVSADVTDSEALVDLAEKTAEHIVIFKTHIDIINDFSIKLTKHLRMLADKHQFLIFEDRKFADIGHTVLHQVKDGIYHIGQWADIINAHTLPGEGIINGLKAGCDLHSTGLLLLAQMSSHNNLFTQDYVNKTIELAKKHPDFVMGFIAQEKICNDPALITMTPGVKLTKDQDTLGQVYNSPEHVIQQKQSDIIIVGRGIYAADDPAASAAHYKNAGWQAYLRQLL